MEILTGLPEGLINSALYDVAKKILKKDPIRSALDQTIDELTRDKKNGWYELREIDRNQKEIFNNINIIEEATFLKILINNGVLPEIASRLYMNFSEKFNENIKEAAKKEPEVFFHYVIRELEKNKTINEKLVKLLTGFALKNEVYLDRIIKHFEDLEKIPNIPDIQSILRKGEISEGEFFRKEPVWVDYEQGFIVERKEVNEIKKKLEKDRIQLVLGAPSSGKSIILKNVGFKLANQNKVYVMELKKHPQDEIKLFFDYIPKINDDNPIFIIDDAHLCLSECERLIRNFRSKGKGNLIIGLRETEEIKKGDTTISSEFEPLSKTALTVTAEEVTEEMIKTFLQSKYNLSDERIKSVSGNLEIFKEDLWFLSWALKSFNPKKNSVEKEDICEKIRDSVRKIKVGEEKPAINAEDAFLPLSVFYRFEIPIERYFLEEQMGIEENIINQLIGLQEIMEKEEIGRPKMLSLNHSSIAKLYFGTYQNFPDLGRRTKKKILNGRGQEDLEYYSFYRYITTLTDKRNVVDVAISLGYLTLFKKLAEEGNIQNSIEKGLEKEEDIERVGNCLSGIAWTSKEVAMKLADIIDINLILTKIEKEEDITKIGYFLEIIKRLSERVALKLVESIDINSIIDKGENCLQIGTFMGSIANANIDLEMKMCEKVDIDLLSSKIEKNKGIIEVGWFVGRKVNKYLAMKLVESVIKRIEMEEDIKNIGDCVEQISMGNRKHITLKLVENLDIYTLSSKIEKEENIGKIGSCVKGITEANETMGLKLINNIDIYTLSSKIEKEEDIRKIGGCLLGFTIANGDMGLKLVNSIDIETLTLKIDKEENIELIGAFVNTIAMASKEVGLELAGSVSAKINREEDIEKILTCISNVQGSKEVANKIFNRLNPKLREEIQKRMLYL